MVVKRAIANPNKSSPCSTEALLLHEMLLVGCTWSSPPPLRSSGLCSCFSAGARDDSSGPAEPYGAAATNAGKVASVLMRAATAVLIQQRKYHHNSAVQRGAPSGILRGSQAVAEPWSIPGRLIRVLPWREGSRGCAGDKSSNSRTALQLLLHDLALLRL